MFTITKNVAISQIREDGRYSEIPIEDMEGDLSLSYQADDLDTMILEKAINILTQEERSIILLHAVSGWTHREIGISLGLPLSTVLSKYHRGLKKLKKHLQNQGVNHEK
jgi:RNA polymerase sigma-70 factor (ECF subfamily)